MCNVFDIEDITEDKKEFVIDSDAKADWAINIIKQEQAEQERLINSIDEQIEILKAKKERIAENDKCRFLKGKLNQYFESITDGKKELKTCIKYKLANGELIFKKSQKKYERDDKAILEWLNQHDKYDYIKVTHSVDWSALKDADFLNEVNGITEIDTEPTFEVK